jgi:putative ABC transport system ATP-binding protein
MHNNVEPVILLDNITKVFFTDEIETHALAGINLEIHAGEYVSIAGPSGCGKSTLLSIVGLLDCATEGSYRLEGQEVAKLNAAQRAEIRNQKVGFIFQNFNLIGDLTVSQNVELALRYRGVALSQRKTAAAEALDKVGLSHRARHFPSQLSGGQQQRVAVARAIVGKPSILLADEPTGNLDSKNSEAIMGLLSDLHRQGVTICMVTHDPRFADNAERSVQLFDGRVLEESCKAGLLQNE